MQHLTTFSPFSKSFLSLIKIESENHSFFLFFERNRRKNIGKYIYSSSYPFSFSFLNYLNAPPFNFCTKVNDHSFTHIFHSKNTLRKIIKKTRTGKIFSFILSCPLTNYLKTQATPPLNQTEQPINLLKLFQIIPSTHS